MLAIINNLKPFFEDCYRRINVREYSRLMKISPPTASKMLFDFNKEGLLLIEKDRNYIFYYANKNNQVFVDLSRIYWRNKLIELLDYLNKQLLNPAIILFGSLAKAEAKIDSDVDLCMISYTKELNLKGFEKKIKRRLQVFFFKSLNDIDNPELKNNILNGYILNGRIKL